MKKNFKNLLKDFNNFFEKEPNSKIQAWSLLNEFYHILLTYMKNQGITQSELAQKVGVSRSAISQLFNRQPNITLNKISEISNSIGLKLSFSSDQIKPMYESKVIILKQSFHWKQSIKEEHIEIPDKVIAHGNSNLTRDYNASIYN